MKKLRQILFLDSFSKSIAENDLALQQRFRLFGITTLFTVLVFIILLFQAVTAETGSLPVIIVSFLFFLVFINYFALAVHQKHKFAFFSLAVLMMALLHVITYWSGGIRNSGIFYLGTIIFTAYMLLGKKGGFIIAGLSVVNVIYFYFVSTYTNWTNYAFVGTEPHLIDLDFLLSGTFGILMLSAQANYIEKSKNAIIDDINFKKNELAINNSLLMDSQKALTQKNIKYEEKNKELEQFAYVASHDLQEPLRTTSSFVELLHEQYHGKFEANADKYLTYILESSDRMKTLINDLLDYSRIGSNKELQKIDCNIILKEVIADLDKIIKDVQAEISFEQLPVIPGYRTEIKQLFQNLIMNAIKFRKVNSTPMVNISAKKNKDHWTFSVQDNGIGISKEHQERIFIIFQRLHTRSEYQGSGIGLAHCKKIVGQHGGKLWVESTLGKGAVFHFTIPEIITNE